MAAMPAATVDERRGHARHESFQAEEQRDHRETQRERGGGRLGQALEQREQILQERALREMHAEQLRHLIEHDHDADAGFEARQHGLRDEIGEKTHAQHGSQHEQDADHQAPAWPRRAATSRRIAIGHHQRQLAPVRIAIVVVVVTLSTRELPSTA